MITSKNQLTVIRVMVCLIDSEVRCVIHKFSLASTTATSTTTTTTTTNDDDNKDGYEAHINNNFS